MKCKKGDMFIKVKKKDYLIVTTNSTIKKDGSLVMGRGAALQMRDTKVGSDSVFGKLIGLRSSKNHSTYGLIIYNKIGAFQVKHHYKDKASLELIRKSTNRLRYFAEAKPDCIFNLNYPGIGYGGLEKKDVSPIIKRLPDNVVVWERE